MNNKQNQSDSILKKRIRKFKTIKRAYYSLIVLIIISPLLILISIFIKLDSKGKILYNQKRVGINGKEFKLFKFRTMKPGSDKKGLLTIGNDTRITRVGNVLRKTNKKGGMLREKKECPIWDNPIDYKSI